MAGGYIDLPSDFAALAGAAVRVTGQPATSAFFPAWLVTSLPDIMRGEETILYGLVCQGIETVLSAFPAHTPNGHGCGLRD